MGMISMGLKILIMNLKLPMIQKELAIVWLSKIFVFNNIKKDEFGVQNYTENVNYFAS